MCHVKQSCRLNPLYNNYVACSPIYQSLILPFPCKNTTTWPGSLGTKDILIRYRNTRPESTKYFGSYFCIFISCFTRVAYISNAVLIPDVATITLRRILSPLPMQAERTMKFWLNEPMQQQILLPINNKLNVSNADRYAKVQENNISKVKAMYDCNDAIYLIWQASSSFSTPLTLSSASKCCNKEWPVRPI